jgi:predicted secreted hydrolase
VVISSVWGYGAASLAVGPKNASASASGTLDAVGEDFDECTGESAYEELPAFDFNLDLTATSPTIKESGRGSFHVPGEFNSHSSYRATYRFAEGTFDGADGSQSVSGQIGRVSWMEHTNG